MSILGGIIAAAATVGASILGHEQNRHETNKLMDKQADMNKALTKWNYLYSPKFMMQGYKDAGMNPILYASNGVGAAPSVSLGSTAQADYSGALSDGVNAFMNGARTMSDVALNETQADVNKQNVISNQVNDEMKEQANIRENRLAAEQEKVYKSQQLLNGANAARAVSDLYGNLYGVKFQPLMKAFGLTDEMGNLQKPSWIKSDKEVDPKPIPDHDFGHAPNDNPNSARDAQGQFQAHMNRARNNSDIKYQEAMRAWENRQQKKHALYGVHQLYGNGVISR